MWLCLTLLGSLLLGGEVSRRVWKDLSFVERALFGALTGILLWLASDWALALTHQLTRAALIVRTLLFLAAAVALLIRRSTELRTLLAREVGLSGEALVLAAVPVLLLFLWVDYCLWRGAVAPPISFDALSYHLPKAIFFARAHGFDALRPIRFVFSWRPSNYELLLTDALVSNRSDALTEWISILFYAVFVLSGVALCRRWWGADLRALAVVALVTASIPVLLLHAVEFKNDVMAFSFLLGGAVALGRWLTDRDWASLLLAIAAFIAAAGTKTHALLFAAIAAPVIVWSLWRAPLRQIAMLIVAVLLCGTLLGGADYVSHALDRLHRAEIVTNPAPDPSDRGYGDWANLWKGPYVLIAESFAPSDTWLRVPWSDARWPRYRYEMYYSELGVPFALCAVVLPFCVWRTRPQARREALLVTAIAFATFAAILPVKYFPEGLFLMALPRFVLFIAPIVFAWTLPPLMRRRLVANVMLAAAAVIFVFYAVENAVHDAFVPFDYVVWASENRGARLPPHARARAATAVLDLVAGPSDHVAMDAGTTSLIYLTFGPTLERQVSFIPPGPGPVRIDPSAQWVVVDRAWNVIWGHRDLRDLGSASRYIGKGSPTADDLRVVRALLRDRRFEAVYLDAAAVQAVFKRAGAGQPAGPARPPR